MESGQMIRRGAASRYGRAVGFIVRLILGGLFIFAGIAKIYDPGTFAVEVDRYQLVPWKICVATAYYLPWVEFLAGLSLFLRSFERGALLLITLLLSVFTLALASALARGLNIDCGCFGNAFASTGTILPILRNLVLLLLTGILWTKYR